MVQVAVRRGADVGFDAERVADEDGVADGQVARCAGDRARLHVRVLRPLAVRMFDPDVVVVVLAEPDDRAVGDVEGPVAIEVLRRIEVPVTVDVGLVGVLAAVLGRVGVHRHAVEEQLARIPIDVEAVPVARAVAVRIRVAVDVDDRHHDPGSGGHDGAGHRGVRHHVDPVVAVARDRVAVVVMVVADGQRGAVLIRDAIDARRHREGAMAGDGGRGAGQRGEDARAASTATRETFRRILFRYTMDLLRAALVQKYPPRTTARTPPREGYSGREGPAMPRRVRP